MKKSEKRLLDMELLEALYFEGPFNKETVSYFNDLLQKYENMNYTMRIIVDRGNDYEEDRYYLYGSRLETDEELEARLKNEKQIRKEKKQQKAKEKAETEKNELELLAKLKAKYEG